MTGVEVVHGKDLWRTDQPNSLPWCPTSLSHTTYPIITHLIKNLSHENSSHAIYSIFDLSYDKSFHL